MRLIRMLGLALVVAVAAMAFVGATAAIAGPSQLCTVDSANDAACNPADEPMEVHLTSVDNAGKLGVEEKLIPSFGITIKCDVLLLLLPTLG